MTCFYKTKSFILASYLCFRLQNRSSHVPQYPEKTTTNQDHSTSRSEQEKADQQARKGLQRAETNNTTSGLTEVSDLIFGFFSNMCLITHSGRAFLVQLH